MRNFDVMAKAVLSILCWGAMPKLVLLAQTVSPEQWPQWRGSARDGQSAGPEWPSTLEAGVLQEQWRVSGLGPSYAGPVVRGNSVFTVETEEEEREVVRAYDRRDGKPLWTKHWDGALKVPFFAARNGSWVRATPAIDGDSLYVAGMRDVLQCLDTETGEIRWSVDLAARFDAPLPDFGFASSPMVFGEHIYLQAASSFVKLDKRNGETVWRVLMKEGNKESAFSSPIWAKLAGREQILVQMRNDLVSVDPETGASLWSTPVRAFRGMNILTPLCYGNSVFTSSYGGNGLSLEVSAKGEELSVAPRWENKAQAYMSSPVVVGDYAYVFLRSNRFTCVDLRTGEQPWTSPPSGDEYWSLVARGDKILALANTGILRLIRANPTSYDLLSEVTLVEEESWAHLAVVDEQIIVRSQHQLGAWKWRQSADANKVGDR